MRQWPKHVIYGPCLTLHKDIIHRQPRLVIGYLVTDFFCNNISTSAFARGLSRGLLSDATGTVDRKQHETGLLAQESGFGNMVKTEDVLRKLA